MMSLTVRRMLDDGWTNFTCQEWGELSGMNAIDARDACDYLLQHRLIRNISDRKFHAVYAFLNNQPANSAYAKGKASEADADGKITLDREMNTARPSKALIAQLKEVLSREMGARRQCISGILLNMIEKKVFAFRTEDVIREYNIPKSTCNNMLRDAVNLGFLRKEPCKGGKAHYLYVINQRRKQGIRSEGLTKTQREIITALYNTFKTSEFNVFEGSTVVSQQAGSLSFHLHNLAQRGILNARPGNGGAFHYSLAVNPDKNPICFLSENSHSREATSPSWPAAAVSYAAASA